ncbi:MAG: hypothetical protein WCV68_01160 [Candidatus Paceibacterota bacterium]|jgi:hypothetical protein
MSPLENFWHKDKNDKELRDEVDQGVEEALDVPLSVQEDEKIPLGLIDTAEFFYHYGEEKADEIFGWYEKAITRRGREALGSSSFFYHFFTEGSTERNFMFGNNRDGYLLGPVRHGVFIPSHFAPRSLRGGVALMKGLGESETIPAVLAIPDDLAETLSKMPVWRKTGLSFPTLFRGQIQNKQIVYNSHPEVKGLLPLLKEDYEAEVKRFFRNREEDEENSY